MTANIIRPGDEGYDTIKHQFLREKGGDVSFRGMIYMAVQADGTVVFVPRFPATGIPEHYETVSMTGPSVNPAAREPELPATEEPAPSKRYARRSKPQETPEE